MKSKNSFKKVLAKALLLFIFLGGINSYFQSATAQNRYRQVLSDTLANGVIHTHLKGVDDSLNIHLVKVNFLHPDIRIGSARAGQATFGREKTSTIAKINSVRNESVLVAINADFFDLKTGEIENNQVTDGRIVHGIHVTDSPHDVFDNVHSQFALTRNNEPHIDRFRLDGEIILQEANGSKLQIDRINSSTDSSELILYNSYSGLYSPAFDGKEGMSLSLQKIKLQSDTTYYLVQRKSLKGYQPIPPKGAVLVGFGEFFPKLQKFSDVGDTLKSILKFKPEVGQIKTLVGGWPRIVRDGKNIAKKADSLEGTFPRFSKVRHPRTGTGFSRDSTILFLITVDGRQESSTGMTLTEFADFMLSKGVYQGLNLDGGGSTTMVIKGKVVNSPSDTSGERPVGNALLIYVSK